jgi:hypothetical protein
MLVGNRGFRKGLRTRAEEWIDRLIVVAGEHGVLGVSAPLPEQAGLHKVEILSFVSEDC